MASSIRLRVLTDAGLAIEDEAVSIIAPGERGYVGFLRNHAPLVTTLRAGKLWWRTPAGGSRTAHIGEGLLEISRNRLTVLTAQVEESP